MMSVDCIVCGKAMDLAVKPRERWSPLPKNEQPTMISYVFDEWVCPNNHRRDLTYAESRMLE